MIHAVGPDYVRESDYPDMDWQQEQERFYLEARIQLKATKPVPSWLAVVSAAVVFGAISWTLLELWFSIKGW